jgi:mono/diheme cytochrome c family protein
MADIPKHLLERAAARRAALSGAEAPTPTAAPSEAAVPAVVADAPVVAAPAGGGGGAAVVPPAAAASVPAPPPPPKGLGFARMGSVFMLVALPVWLFFMFNTFSVPSASADSPEAVGERLYNANCVACHGANGAGSDVGLAGRPLYNGEVDKTFPDPLAQFAFVRHGSCAAGAAYGNPKRAGGQHVGKGGMPNFGAGALSDAELLAVINYERHLLAGEEYPVNPLVKAGEPEAEFTKVVPEADVAKALADTKITTEDVCG